MAGWRQAIDLAMTDEEIASLRTISRSRTELARRVERAQMLLAYREIRRFSRWGAALGFIIKKSSAVSSGRWPMARWRRLMTDCIQAGSRRSRQRPRPGWCLWHATRPRITAIRTSCGQHGSWPAMRGSTARRWGAPAATAGAERARSEFDDRRTRR